MNLKPKQREEPDINLAPLLDVVFLLLIFFMVSTTFKRDTTLKVDLPESSSKPVAAKTDVIELTINKEGQYYIGNKKIINSELSTLKRALTQEAKGNEQTPLVIRADAMTPHQYVVRALDAARQLGILNLSIATVQAKE